VINALILSLVDKSIGLTCLEKSRRGRKNIKRRFRDLGGDIGNYFDILLTVHVSIFTQ